MRLLLNHIYTYLQDRGIVREGLLFLGLIFVFSGCSTNKPSETKKENSLSFNENTITEKPNIIFFLSDDQDIYDYGCYGNEKVHTPAVDQLAREGMLFEKAFTGQAICAPSRSQLYSGQYPLKNGCFANHSAVKKDLKSVTKHMSRLGYEVILAGKSHVKPSGLFKWDRAWKPVDKESVPRPYIPLDSIQNYFDKASKPFCMFITSALPHGKYYEVENAQATDIKTYPFNVDQKDDKAFIKKKAGYYRSIEENNKQLEKVLEWVDESLKENTIFIYSADHGVSGKFTVYDRGLNVPFIVRWPGVIKAGTKSNKFIHYTDILPTFMEVAGGEPADDMDGKSFLPLLKGSDQEIHKYIYGVQTNQNIQRAAVFPSRMIRDKQYKYIRNFNSMEVIEKNLGENTVVNAFIKMGAMKFKEKPFEELYDLTNDPYEQVNLVSLPEYKKIKERLIADMFLWMKDQGDILDERPGNMPIITPMAFRLDQNTDYLTIPDSLVNTLNPEDYFRISHWQKK